MYLQATQVEKQSVGAFGDYRLQYVFLTNTPVIFIDANETDV